MKYVHQVEDRRWYFLGRHSVLLSDIPSLEGSQRLVRHRYQILVGNLVMEHKNRFDYVPSLSFNYYLALLIKPLHCPRTSRKSVRPPVRSWATPITARHSLRKYGEASTEVALCLV